MAIVAESAMTGSYDPFAVAQSVVIAVAASFAALDLAGRITAARGRARQWWGASGAVAMGIGIWSMHFTGMVAFRLPIPVGYYWPTVLLSLLIAIVASGLALYVVSRKTMPAMSALAGGIAMGGGIAILHYVCMAAMRMAADTYYSPYLVALSVLFAIGFSLTALWLGFFFRGDPEGRGWEKIGAAVIMGAAICTMHYTGMAAASYVPSSITPVLTHAVTVSSLGRVGVTVVTLVILGQAMLMSSADRRFSRQALELALTEARAELARVARVAMLGEMATSIAHEISQPLVAVTTSASSSLRWLARQPPNLDEALAAAEETVREANRASAVISKIRALLKKEPPRAEQLEIKDVIQQVLELARRELARARITVRTELDPEAPALIGDRVQLQQVILNLILNAIDALVAVNDEPRMLVIRSARAEEGVLVQIQDFGKGIDARETEKIFEPFFTTKPWGIGLGLSVSRSIIEAHGGQLWVTPGSPRGSVFQFLLPKART